MADIVADEFSGPADSISGRPIGSYTWSGGLELNGSGALGAVVDGTGDFAEVADITALTSVADEETLDFSFTMAAAVSSGSFLFVSLGRKTLGDSTPGNLELHFNTTSSFDIEIRGGDAETVSMGSALTAGDVIRIRTSADQIWICQVYRNDTLVYTFDGSPFAWNAKAEPSFMLSTKTVGLIGAVALGTAAAPTPSNVLIKNTEVETTVELKMIPGTPYQPARAGYYSYEQMTACGWQYAQPGHWSTQTDPMTRVTTIVWVYDGPKPAPTVIAQWVCQLMTVAVWHPPTPEVPATPPRYYPNVRYSTGYNLGWNSGARSIGVFFDNANVQFQASPSNVGVIAGMNIDDGAPVTYNGRTINYGFYLARGVARIMQNGSLGALVGNYDENTIFRVERVDDAITYKMDGATVATVATGAPTGPGWLEAAMYSADDIVFNPIIEQIDTPTAEDVTGDMAGSLRAMVGLMTSGEHADMAGALRGLTGTMESGLLVPSYAVMAGSLSIFSGEIHGLTGGLGQMEGSLREIRGLAADHAYGEMSGALYPVVGQLLALEGNERASINGAAAGVAKFTGRTILVVSLVSRAQISAAYTATISLSAELLSKATLSTLLSFTSTQRAVLLSVAAASELAKVPEGDVETWVINLDGSDFGSTSYSGYDFNSYAEIGGRFYGAGQGGLMLLDGDDDAGEPIRAVIGLGERDGGNAQKKTWSGCYIGMSAKGNLFVKVIAEGREFIYKTRSFSDKLQQQRVTFGKGLRTNYVTLELYNEDGADFEVDTVEFHVADLSRKI